MFIEATKLIGLPVAASDTQSKIGEIRQIVIDPENGRLLGFVVSKNELFHPKKVLSVIDIKDWDPNGVVVDSIDNLIDSTEILRINELLAKRINFLNMKAETQSGKSLGEVEDILIDTGAQVVVKYYLRDVLGSSRIFPSEKVVKIEKKTIYFTDDNAEMPQDAAAGVVKTA